MTSADDISAVRDAVPGDVPRLLEIYRYYVLNTAVTFDYEVPSEQDFARQLEEISSRYPYLVIEAGGRTAGYACAHPFVGRQAYDWSAETTIYMDPDMRGRGLGAKLYAALEERLREMGILNLYACIGFPGKEDEYLTTASADFHAHLGFRKVGEFRSCGYKFGRWYHMIWMEKVIGEHRQNQPPVSHGARASRQGAEKGHQ